MREGTCMTHGSQACPASWHCTCEGQAEFHGLLSLTVTIKFPLSFTGKSFYASPAVQEGHKIALICISPCHRDCFYLSYSKELNSTSKDTILQHEALDQELYLKNQQKWCSLDLNVTGLAPRLFLNVYKYGFPWQTDRSSGNWTHAGKPLPFLLFAGKITNTGGIWSVWRYVSWLKKWLYLLPWVHKLTQIDACLWVCIDHTEIAACFIYKTRLWKLSFLSSDRCTWPSPAAPLDTERFA